MEIDDKKLESPEVQQYLKDMKELNELTNDILNNYPSYLYKRDKKENASHDQDIMNIIEKRDKPKEKEIEYFGNKTFKEFIENPDRSYGGIDLSEKIKEKIKEKIVEDSVKPSLIQDLEKFGMYNIHLSNDNKYTAFYIDFVESDSEKNETDNEKKIVNMLSDISDLKETLEDKLKDKTQPIRTLNMQVFTKTGFISEKLIPINRGNLYGEVSDYLNSKYIEIIKELANKNYQKEDRIVNVLKLIEFKKSEYPSMKSKIQMRIESLSNLISSMGRRGHGTFILASIKNMEYILKSYTIEDKVGKTTLHNNPIPSVVKYHFISNDEMGNTVIVGRKPQKDEPGISLIVNKNSLKKYDYECSDDDITGLKLEFDFVTFGLYPEKFYCGFELNVIE